MLRSIVRHFPAWHIAGCLAGVIVAALWLSPSAHAHDVSRHRHERERRAALAKAAAQQDPSFSSLARDHTCSLTIELIDEKTRTCLPGLVRILNAGSGKAIPLEGQIMRALNWYAVPERVVVNVPRIKLTVQALHGLEREQGTQAVDCTGRARATARIPLKRFYNAGTRGFRSGNTHVHLMKLAREEAERYLRLVPRADNLDLVFLSHLRRIPEETDYISNAIVAESFQGDALSRLASGGLLFGNGQEHRHNFGAQGEGFGHVMLLNLTRLIHPVSIGPGIMKEGTDGRPLRRGMEAARADGAGVIWCHNSFGLEDLPNWMAGLLDAQNIFDGGEHGSYRDTFYRYLHLGMRVPFSTGTDWFIYDFSRAYVRVEDELTVPRWLSQLKAGRSYITNGPFLELTVDGHSVGDTISLSAPRSLQVRARGIGRADFRGLELIANGEVVHVSATRPQAGHFVADMEYTINVREPGWIALRIPLEAGTNELDRLLFAHTSPIYVEISGKRIFRSEVASGLIAEMQQSIDTILSKAVFAGDEEREAVMKVYREGIAMLRGRLAAAR